MRLGIGLGSNLGDRLQNLQSAANEIRNSLHETGFPFLCSKIYETLPVDCPPSSPSFYNAAVELECTLPAPEILRWCQALEKNLGRPADHGYHLPRTIDLDLLYYGDNPLIEHGLALPHPRISSRLFVVLPLSDIVPAKILPGCPHGVAARAIELSKSDPIHLIGDLL